MACLVEFPAIDYLNAITERYFQDLSRFKESVSNLQLKYGKIINERDLLQAKVNNLIKSEEELRRQLASQQTITTDGSFDKGISDRSMTSPWRPIQMASSTISLREHDIKAGTQTRTYDERQGKKSDDSFFLENPKYLDKFIRRHVTREQLEHWLEEKTRVAVVIDKEVVLTTPDKRNEEVIEKQDETHHIIIQGHTSHPQEWIPHTEDNSVVHHNTSTPEYSNSNVMTSGMATVETQDWPRPTPVQKKTLALGGNIKIPAGRDLNTTCRLCGKQFSSPSVRNRHMLSHSGQRPHKCDICGKGFILASHLKGHLGTHFKREVFKCRRCQIEFKNAATLDEHMMLEHKIERRCNCTVCGKWFSEVSQLKKHMLVHTDVQPFKCDCCGNQYLDAASLKRHMRLHTGEKPFCCKICGRRFTFASNMRAHKQRHANGESGESSEVNEPELEPEPFEEEQIEAEEFGQ